MAEQLFQRVAVLSDIHLGLKQNSQQHNQDCLDFVDWFIEEAKKEKCEAFIFCGDWHNSRSTINVSTLNYTYQAFSRLNKSFDQGYLIVGNHDSFYRHSIDTNSIKFAELFPNITVIDKITEIGDTTLVPWLVENEWKKIEKIKSRYIFCHIELQGFLINSMVEMPETGGLKLDHFKNQEYAFSGHFHKRQVKKNVVYIGNCFPHNFSDAGDDDRGAMFMEWGKDPIFKSWPNAPKYRILKFSEVLENPSKYLDHRTYAKFNLDLDLTYEEALFVKECLQKQLNVRELSIVPNQEFQDDYEYDGQDVKFESVDQIVTTMLANTDSSILNTDLLISIYRAL